MKKETILLLGLGAAAVYFLMRKRRDYSDLVSVESPEKITEAEFEAAQPSETTSAAPILQRGKSLLESVKNIAQQTREKIKRKRALKDIMFLPGMSKPISKKQFQKTVRQQKAKQRKAARMERRVKRRMGDLSIMY